MRRCVLLVGVALSLAFAPAPLPKPDEEDLKRMQGEWVPVRPEWGAPDPSFPPGGLFLVIGVKRQAPASARFGGGGPTTSGC
jgi:hypothetical protein